MNDRISAESAREVIVLSTHSHGDPAARLRKFGGLLFRRPLICQDEVVKSHTVENDAASGNPVYKVLSFESEGVGTSLATHAHPRLVD